MADKPESNLERERTVQETFERLLSKRKSEKAEGAEAREARIEEMLTGIPEEQKAEIRAADKELEADGITDPSKRAKHLEKSIATYRKLYQDQRFEVGEGERMANLEYGKKKTVEWLGEILDAKDSKPEDLTRIAFISFDANGLKGVNDLSTHTNGTAYLQRIAEALHDPKSETAKWLREQGVTEMIPMSAGGGDEYGALIRSDKPLDGILAEAVKRLEAEIEAAETGDLVDFEDADTLKKLRDKGVKMAVPAGFKMRASASGGGATLYDGLIHAAETPNENKRLSGKDSARAEQNKIMGGLWDAADETATSSKNVFKAGLMEAPEGSDERFYGEILTLGRKSAEDLVQEQQSKRRKVDSLTKEIVDAAMSLGTGVMKPEDYMSFVAERQKAIAELNADLKG
jgi:hypothetical protein